MVFPRTRTLLLAIAFAAALAPAWMPALLSAGPQSADLALPQERHLKNVRQLTFGGENAEAYFSSDDKHLIFQSRPDTQSCDQMFTMDVDGSNRRQVSTGGGRTTCGYFYPDGKHILYSSTRGAGSVCPPPPDWSKGYVWKMYPEYEIYRALPDGSQVEQLTHNLGYDAEATISRDGRTIVFTSLRNGDLDIYTMDAHGGHLRRLTTELGYDGGPFFSADGKKIVYRAYHPETPEEVEDYKELLRTYELHPRRFEIFVMNADGSSKRRLTHFGAASFAPFFHPDGKRIIFASNRLDPKGRNFDLYLINEDGSGLEQVTYDPQFDAFPMFSSDGKFLVWAANRNGKVRGETNIFIADWID